jgi:hypothetical protein
MQDKKCDKENQGWAHYSPVKKNFNIIGVHSNRYS